MQRGRTRAMEGKMEAMEADADGRGGKRRKGGVGGRAGRKKETCEGAEDENARARRSRGAIPAAQSMATMKYERLLGDGTWNEVRMEFRHAHDANRTGGWAFGRRLPLLAFQG